MFINGKNIAAHITAQLKKEKKPVGKMVAIVASDDVALVSFLRLKEKYAKALGVPFELYAFPATVTTSELVARVEHFSNDATVAAIAIELPLPKIVDAHTVLDAVAPSKDPECLHSVNLGKFFDGTSKILPPSVATVKTILETLHVESLEDKVAVVVGAGFLVGQPVAHWLRKQVRKIVTLRSISTDDDRRSALAEADIIVTGVGKSGLVTGAMIKPGAIVIDFGFPADVDAESIDRAGGIVTPTPGGTGPVLIAELFRNFYRLANRV